MAELAALRLDYGRAGLRRLDLEADPVAHFRLWLSEATAAALAEPNAMVLANGCCSSGTTSPPSSPQGAGACSVAISIRAKPPSRRCAANCWKKSP